MQPLGDPSQNLPAGISLGARGVNQRTTAEVACPRSMVGRVIGKNGETIKALQLYTNALIQIDQSTDPTRVTISGTPQSLELAISMVTDICKGTFKGFALLRQLIQPQRGSALPGQQPFNLGPSMVQQRPVYAPGYGLIPPSQLYGETAVGGTSTTLITSAAAGPSGLGGAASMGALSLGGRPVTLQLPPGYQYATLQPSGALQPLGGGVGDPSQQQVLVQGLGGTHHLTAAGQLVDSSGAGALLGSVQLPMQQVYSVPAQGGGFAQTVTYAYSPQDFVTTTGVGGEQLQLYPQSDGTLLSLQPAAAQQAFGGLQAAQQHHHHALVAAAPAGSAAHVVAAAAAHPHHAAAAVQQHAQQQAQQQQAQFAAAGSSTGKALLAAAGPHGALAARPSSGATALQVGIGGSGAAAAAVAAGGPQPRWSSGSGWVDASKVAAEPQTMGQVAVSELLGATAGGAGAAGGGGPGGGPHAVTLSALAAGSGGSGGPSSGQQLVQVIGPEGNVVSYYHLAGGAAPGGAGAGEHQ